jgi:hypothetical protein
MFLPFSAHYPTVCGALFQFTQSCYMPPIWSLVYVQPNSNSQHCFTPPRALSDPSAPPNSVMTISSSLPCHQVLPPTNEQLNVPPKIKETGYRSTPAICRNTQQTSPNSTANCLPHFLTENPLPCRREIIPNQSNIPHLPNRPTHHTSPPSCPSPMFCHLHTHFDSPNTSPCCRNNTIAWPTPLSNAFGTMASNHLVSPFHPPPVTPNPTMTWKEHRHFPSIPHSSPAAERPCHAEYLITSRQPVLPVQGDCTAPWPKGCPGVQGLASWCACPPPHLEAWLLLPCPQFGTG